MKKCIPPLLFMAILFSLSACKKFQYNVFETDHFKKDPEVSTGYNIARLLKIPNKETLHVVFTGDTQRFYDDLEDLIKVVNGLQEVDAVMIMGDISDFSTAREYELINRQLKQLKVPFITVIGNHDCLANGSELYEDIYGPMNYSFTWNDIRFVGHNTNGREFGYNGTVPDLNWMQQQLSDTANYHSCIFISHIPPNNGDFDRALEPAYTKIIREAKNTIFNVYGHLHGYELSQPYNDNIWYLSTSSPSKRMYCYVTLYPHAVSGKKFDCTSVPF